MAGKCLPPERREGSGRVGQLMEDRQRRKWRMEQEQYSRLKEQPLHLPPAIQLSTVLAGTLLRLDYLSFEIIVSLNYVNYLCMDGYQVGGRPRRSRMSSSEHRNVHSLLTACSSSGWSPTITSTCTCPVTASGGICVVSRIDCGHHAGKTRLADACVCAVLSNS